MTASVTARNVNVFAPYPWPRIAARATGGLHVLSSSSLRMDTTAELAATIRPEGVRTCANASSGSMRLPPPSGGGAERRSNESTITCAPERI